MKNIGKQKNIEALLLMAKYDEEFYETLFSDRKKAITDTGLDLSKGERLLLRQISDEQLKQAIMTFRIPGIERKSLPCWKKALSVVILVTSIISASECIPPAETGIAPDEPTAEPTERPV